MAKELHAYTSYKGRLPTSSAPRSVDVNKTCMGCVLSNATETLGIPKNRPSIPKSYAVILSRAILVVFRAILMRHLPDTSAFSTTEPPLRKS